MLILSNQLAQMCKRDVSTVSRLSKSMQDNRIHLSLYVTYANL